MTTRLITRLSADTAARLVEAASSRSLTPEALATEILRAAFTPMSPTGMSEPEVAWVGDLQLDGSPGPDLNDHPTSPVVLDLDNDMIGKIASAAQATGIPDAAIVASIIESEFFDRAAFDWSEEAIEDVDATSSEDEPGRPWEEVRPELEALIDRLFPASK